ncbi:MAG: DNA polymerase III subunit gamma/tau [Chloroflexota bacterium]|nr:DNA polymerase III subunit gamma/tau [Chloroflexota bacterium]
MATQVLYRKWRSQTFEEVIGQEHVTRTLRNAIRDGRIAHAYLFTGPRGTGKTSTARLLAKAVNCLEEDPGDRPDNTCEICQAITEGSLLDLIEIDAASNRGIDEIRDLRDRVHYSPGLARYKVYVIDEVHMLTTEAFNALLKTLEEPPAHVIFVLATTEPHKIPDTVLSRCQRFDFRRIPSHLIVERLAYILEQEERAAEPVALEMIARSSEGCMRDAISLIDQLLSYGGEVITEAQVQAVRGTISGQAIAEIVDYMVARDAGGGLALVNQMANEGIDLRQLALQLVAHLRSVLLVRVGGEGARDILSDLSEQQLAVVQTQADELEAGTVSRAIRAINQASREMRDSPYPQLVLELAWLEVVEPSMGAALAPTGSLSVAAPPPISRAAATERVSVPKTFGREQSPSERREASAGPPLPKADAPVPEEDIVETLRANWTPLLFAAEEKSGASLRGALRTLRNVVAQGDDVYFAFEHEFAKTVVERPANKAFLQEMLGQILGKMVRLHCQVGTQVTGVSEPVHRPAPTPAVPQGPEEQDLSDDPVAEHARENLGAVTSKIGPTGS